MPNHARIAGISAGRKLEELVQRPPLLITPAQRSPGAAVVKSDGCQQSPVGQFDQAGAAQANPQILPLPMFITNERPGATGG